MIISNNVQGSAGWHEDRFGVLTASRVNDLILPGAAPKVPRFYGRTPSTPASVRGPAQQAIIDQARAAPVDARDIRSDSALRALLERGYLQEVAPPIDADPVIEPLRLSSNRSNLMARLLHEWLTRTSAEEFFGNRWTEHGHQIEGEAVEYAEMMTNESFRPVGHVYRDEQRLAGCSPDALGDECGLEIKGPAGWTHIRWLLESLHGLPQTGTISRGAGGPWMPPDKRGQVQYSLWVTGLPRWYWMSYAAPEESIPWAAGSSMPPLLLEITPDPRYQEAFDEHVPPFIAALLEARELLIERGAITCPRNRP